MDWINYTVAGVWVVGCALFAALIDNQILSATTVCVAAGGAFGALYLGDDDADANDEA